MNEGRELKTDRALLIRALHVVEQKIAQNWPWFKHHVFLNMVNLIRADANEHYLTYSQEDERKVSFASKPELRLVNKSRTRTAFGRYIRRHLKIPKDQLSDQDVHYISNQVIAEKVPVENLVKVVRGQAISQAYKREVGCSSCMTGRDSSLVALYSLNPKKVGLAIFGQNQGRALLWTTDDGDTVLDRVYSDNGEARQYLQRWAENNGYAWREDRCTGHDQSEVLITSDGKVHTVTLDSSKTKRYPYLDTFLFGRFKDCSENELILSNGRRDMCLVFEEVGGDYQRYCEQCNDRHAETERNGEHLCEDCYYESRVDCERCGDSVEEEDTDLVNDDRWCQHCVSRHSFTCHYCGNISDNEHQTSAEDSGNLYCENCACSELTYCDLCGHDFEDEVKELADSTSDKACDNCAGECKKCDDRFPWKELNKFEGHCNFCADELGIEERKKPVKKKPAKKKKAVKKKAIIKAVVWQGREIF